jgi:hypothetical protein
VKLPGEEPAPSGPLLAAAAATGGAVVCLLLAGLAGGPYLDLSELNLWVAGFAVFAFAALFSVPFAVERLLKAADPERAEHWERAMMIWGAVATVALLIGAALIGLGGFEPGGSLADAAGLLLAIEAGMVLVVLLAWLLAG